MPPVGRTLLEASRRERRAPRWDGWAHGTEGNDVASGVRDDLLLRREIGEGMPTGEQLVPEETDRVKSVRWSSFGSPTACSGAMYAVVPIAKPLPVRFDAFANARAMPKSATRA
ncbi:hypothetical protein [Gemmatimonas sp.]|uniref:hypothetical protein n=1 Tax=Gemmatimonas sp. TaxID=1962908 RepID=UPI003982F53D